MENENKNKLKILIGVFIVISIATAWGHSLMPVPVSQAESGFFLDVLRPVLRVFTPDEFITDHLVRKLAHFSEYGIMGIEMTAFLEVSKGIRPRYLVNVLYSGLTISLVDETIQIFSGRGPLISDIWIDLAGIITGGLLACLVIHVIHRGRREEKPGAKDTL